MNDQANSRHMIVLGAGLSGLALAWRLSKAGIRVTVVEKSDHVGGVIQSRRIDGYLCERGPNSMLVKSASAENFVDEIGLSSDIIESNPIADRRYLVKNGRPVAMPMSALSAITTPLYSMRAKLRLLVEPFIKAADADGDESIASFVTRRMGHEFLDYGIDALVSGIWAGDPDQLSIRYAFPKVWNLEARFGSMIGGALKLSRERRKSGEKGYKSRLIAFKDGIEMLPQTLARTSSAKIVTNANLTSISRSADNWTVRWQQADGETSETCSDLVVSTPAFDVPGLPWESTLAAKLGSFSDLYHPPVTTLVLGYRREQVGHPLDGFGMLIPHAEDRRVLGAIFSSTCFPDRAPDDHVSLMIFIGGTTMPECASDDKERSVALATEELGDLLRLKGDPVFSQQTYHRRAIPQYNVGYGEFLAHLGHLEEDHPGLFFCANYRGGPGLSDVLDSSLAMSRRILKQVSSE
jgi:oxygen-dependent protoporphyrinogen oxidase